MSEQEKVQNTTPETLSPSARKPYHGFRIEKVEIPENFNYFDLALEAMPESDLLSKKTDEGNQESPYQCPF